MVKRKRRGTILVLISFFIMLIVASQVAYSAAAILPKAVSNLDTYSVKFSSLTPTDSGYMRVFNEDKKVYIEYYDDSFNITSKKSLNLELDYWGGFFAGKDAYYLVQGKRNVNEVDTEEVIRVIKYDKSWKRIGAAKITGNLNLFGGEVRTPFNHGCVEMAEYNGMLYIATGHEGYVDPAYNQGHQGLLVIAVNEASMTGQIVVSDLWHSFAQYIKATPNGLYLLEQSDGDRGTTLTKIDYNTYKSNQIYAYRYGGSHTSAWAIPCYSSVNGLEISSTNALGIGTSIDQSKYDSVSSDTAHNIYLTVTPLSNFTEEATKVKWLTSYKDNGKSFTGLHITKINDNRFLVSWEEFNTQGEGVANDTLSGYTAHYLFIDGAGNVLGQKYTAKAPVSECQPIVKGGNVVYYASNYNMVNFYKINASSGAFSKKTYGVAGENATWTLKNNTLTISGSGAIDINNDAIPRRPISSIGGYSYSSSDNSWKSIRGSVKKIVISDGITGISDGAFKYFSALETVEVGKDVKKIGVEAFARNGALRECTIFSKTATIGEDAFWTGFYWTYDYSHVIRTSIKCYKRSNAEKYAKANDISYSYINQDISKATITLNPTSYTYDGTAKKPSATVTLDGEKLIVNDDYKLEYSKNTNVGTATVTVKGYLGFTGAATATFKINPIDISKTTIQGVHPMFAYTGSAVKPIPVITATIAGKTETLKLGTDYTLSYKNNTNVGTGSITITGKGRFTGSVTKNFAIKKVEMRRIWGSNRFKTSFAIAKTFMTETKQSQLNCIIVAQSEDAPDALSGSFLSKAVNAPIIVWSRGMNPVVQEFIRNNVKSDGTVYLLGAESVVEDRIKSGMNNYKFVRLAGSNRYKTNLDILNQAGFNKSNFAKTEILVCDGQRFENALIASGTGKPVFLATKGALLDYQQAWLKKNKGKISKFVIVGDKSSVDEKVEKALKAYGVVERINVASVDEISQRVANQFYKNASEVFLATSRDFPDGLCAGPLAIINKGPIMLTNGQQFSKSLNYANSLTDLKRVSVFGNSVGATAVSDAIVKKMAKNSNAKIAIIQYK